MIKKIALILVFLGAVPLFSSPYKLNNQAIEKYHSGYFEEAISDINEAIQKSPDRAIFYNNRGFIKAATDDYFGALSDLNKAIELDNDENAKTLAFFNRGNLKIKNSDYDGAIKDYSNAIRINPKFASAYQARAIAKQKSAELDLKTFKELAD